MNRTDKPKMTSKALIDKLRDEKGVSFKYVTEDNAEKYLAQINNYLRTASYRKNYQKYLNGPSKGKYIDLDFAYLQELSTVDMHLRNLVTRMCIDIEHDLKVLLLENLENDAGDGQQPGLTKHQPGSEAVRPHQGDYLLDDPRGPGNPGHDEPKPAPAGSGRVRAANR